MSLLCKLGLHRWKYKTTPSGFLELDLLFADMTRYCERCERIEKGTVIFMSPFPPAWKKIEFKKKKEVEV